MTDKLRAKGSEGMRRPAAHGELDEVAELLGRLAYDSVKSRRVAALRDSPPRVGVEKAAASVLLDRAEWTVDWTTEVARRWEESQVDGELKDKRFTGIFDSRVTIC